MSNISKGYFVQRYNHAQLWVSSDKRDQRTWDNAPAVGKDLGFGTLRFVLFSWKTNKQMRHSLWRQYPCCRMRYMYMVYQGIQVPTPWTTVPGTHHWRAPWPACRSWGSHPARSPGCCRVWTSAFPSPAVSDAGPPDALMYTARSPLVTYRPLAISSDCFCRSSPYFGIRWSLCSSSYARFS